MSEEETIEYLAIKRAEFLIKIPNYLEADTLQILLNLISKQQKEIEQLKEKCEEHIYIEANKQIQQLYISKDKIRKKMELLELRKAFSDEFTEEFYLSQIELLQELLEGEEE